MEAEDGEGQQKVMWPSGCKEQVLTGPKLGYEAEPQGGG